jgi:molybdenum cofactor biosynthesis enzyme MoaA
MSEMLSPSDFKFSSRVRFSISPECNLKCKYCDKQMENFKESDHIISLSDNLQILKSLVKNGFDGVSFTGGEPMLNPCWDILANKSKEYGFDRVEMTTNGTLINSYLDKQEKFPDSLDSLKVSMDSSSSSQFKKITGSNIELEKILTGIKRLKETNPGLKLVANKVCLKSGLGNLQEYFDFIKQSNFNFCF